MSIIRPPLRPRRGRTLICLLVAATTATAALAPVASNAQAKGRHDLVFKVTGASRQNVIGAHAIVISVRCPVEACNVVASATSSSPSVHTGNLRIQVPAGGSERLTLPLSPRNCAKLKAALEAGKSPTLTVDATAHDPFGGKVPLSIKVRPVKPWAAARRHNGPSGRPGGVATQRPAKPFTPVRFRWAPLRPVPRPHTGLVTRRRSRPCRP